MASKQILIVVLLVVSIIFSVTSILLTMSLDVSNDVVKVPYQFNSPNVGSSAGGVGLIVEPGAQP